MQLLAARGRVRAVAANHIFSRDTVIHGSRSGRIALLAGVESASAGELILHNDCKVANEQGRGRDQLGNNNKVHNQILYMVQAGAVYVLRLTPR